MTLDEIREEINRIDEKLLPLFLARMECAKKVAKIKKEQNLPIFHPERENAILRNVEEKSGEFRGEARILYSDLLEMSRAVQHDLIGSGSALRTQIQAADNAPQKAGKVACLGESGSFSHEELLQLYPKAEPQFCSGFSEIFAAVESGSADLGLLPVENSSAGSVGEVYDLILKYRFYIILASTLHVHHCLAAAQKYDIRSIGTVYSHPQPIAQCSDYIAQHDLHAIPCSSTVTAAQDVAMRREAGIAAICSEYAAKEYGLQILESNIENSSSNCTRFIVISKRLFIPEDAQKISLCFSLVHKTGSLYSVLARFAAAGLNLTKIESRPIRDKNFEYDFYLDFTGNVHDERTLSLLCALYEELPRFSFLGNYTEFE
jgi:chorismate mutase/prephenate dehydratase